jgi:hypothetical protein
VLLNRIDVLPRPFWLFCSAVLSFSLALSWLSSAEAAEESKAMVFSALHVLAAARRWCHQRRRP